MGERTEPTPVDPLIDVGDPLVSADALASEGPRIAAACRDDGGVAIDAHANGVLGALRFGYFDQSHLNRDARAFGGTTPGELLKGLIPDGGGFGL